MDRWKHSHSLFWHVLAPIAVVRRDQSNDFNMGTTSQAAMTNSIDRLPRSYPYQSSHWIGKSTSDLRPIQSVTSDANIQSLWDQSCSCEPVQPPLGMNLFGSPELCDNADWQSVTCRGSLLYQPCDELVATYKQYTFKQVWLSTGTQKLLGGSGNKARFCAWTERRNLLLITGFWWKQAHTNIWGFS